MQPNWTNNSSGFFQVSLHLEGFDQLLRNIQFAVNASAPDVAQSVYAAWRDLAMSRLKTSRVRYLAALQPPVSVVGGLAYAVTLEGNFPVMVEEGADSYDVGRAILNGRSKVVVPFKQTPVSKSHGGTSAFGASATPMGYGYRTTPRGRGKMRYTPPGAIKAGGTLGPGDPWRAIGRYSQAGGHLPRLQREHARPIYAGQGHDKHGGVGGITFRTVTENSKWIHPGIQARHLADTAMQGFGRTAGIILSKHVERL